jgi:type I restriction enzyme S subunit
VKITDMLQGKVTTTEETLSEVGLESCSAKLLPAGTVLISVFATIGRTAVLAIPAATNQAIAGVVPLDPKSIDPSFLRYFLDSKRPQLMREARGVAQPNINQSILRGLEIPLLPVAEQQRIVDLLSRAEGIVRLRRQAQQKAAELIPAVFAEMFGDPATNPKDWPVFALSEVSEVISGVAKGRDLSADESIELPYMRVANVKDGRLDLDEVKTIFIKKTEVEKLRIVPGDLLMTEGGDPDKLGRAALWCGEIDLCVHQNHIFKVRSRRDRLVPEYLRSLVGSAYGKAYFLSVAKKTTGIASINKTQLSAFPVLVPPLATQEKFRRQVEAVEGIAALQEAAAQKAQATFRSLLARAFTETGPQVHRELEEAHA